MIASRRPERQAYLIIKFFRSLHGLLRWNLPTAATPEEIKNAGSLDLYLILSSPLMACEEFRQRYIGKIVRVTTRNQRVFYGKLAAVDDKSNMLLYETAAEIPQQMSHPINLTLTNILDDQLRSNRYLDTSGVSQEQAGKLVSSFAKNKYYFGPVMVASADIAKVEMQRRVLDKPAEPMPVKHMPHKAPEEEKQKEDKPKQLTEHTSEPAENTKAASEQVKPEKQQ